MSRSIEIESIFSTVELKRSERTARLLTFGGSLLALFGTLASVFFWQFERYELENTREDLLSYKNLLAETIGDQTNVVAENARLEALLLERALRNQKLELEIARLDYAQRESEVYDSLIVSASSSDFSTAEQRNLASLAVAALGAKDVFEVDVTEISSRLNAYLFSIGELNDNEKRFATVILIDGPIQKAVEIDSFEGRLRALGFQYFFVEGKNVNVPTNLLWCGADVPITEVRALAALLIAAGIDLKDIRRYRNPQRKSIYLEVGTDLSVSSQSSLTLKQIMSIEECS